MRFPSPPNIFLIGYRCTGKTTVARLLADQLGWNWVDADEVLEARYGTTIRQIFASEGEVGFRDKEEKIFTELCQLRRHVIATGGGVILREINRQRMRAAGTTIWLIANAETIWSRLQSDPATQNQRPALIGGGLAEIQQTLEIRERIYRACADFMIDTSCQHPEDVVQTIILQDWIQLGEDN